jgi:hypothetical protein
VKSHRKFSWLRWDEQIFSGKLDFRRDQTFVLWPYLDALDTELAAYGYQSEMDDRSKVGQAVRKAFVKDDSLGNLLNLNFKPTAGPLRKLRIKLEVDTNPPKGATFETRYLDFPFPSAVCAFDLPSLLAGKLVRPWNLIVPENVLNRRWEETV